MKEVVVYVISTYLTITAILFAINGRFTFKELFTIALRESFFMTLYFLCIQFVFFLPLLLVSKSWLN